MSLSIQNLPMTNTIRSRKVITYSAEEFACIDRHIERYFGKVTQVIDDPSCLDPQIDLLVIGPTSKRDYFTVITRGLGAYSPPDKYPSRKNLNARTELVIRLDKRWFIESDCHDADVWPLRMLLRIAHYAYSQNERFLPNMLFDNGQPLDPSTELRGFIIEELVTDFDAGARQCLLPNYEYVMFFHLTALFGNEIDLLANYELDAFFYQLHQVSTVIGPKRKSFILPYKHHRYPVESFDDWDFLMPSQGIVICAQYIPEFYLNCFVRFCIEGELMSWRFYKQYPELEKDPEITNQQCQEIIANLFPSGLERRYFNGDGNRFISLYFEGTRYPSYKSDLDDIVLFSYGHHYYYRVIANKHQLIMPLVEYSYILIRRLLNKRLASTRNIDFYQDDYEKLLAEAMGKQANCNCSTYYPAMSTTEPLMAHVRHLNRSFYERQEYSLFIEVNEEMLYRLMRSNQHDKHYISSEELNIQNYAATLPINSEGQVELSKANLSVPDKYRQAYQPEDPYAYENYLLELFSQDRLQHFCVELMYTELANIYFHKVNAPQDIAHKDYTDDSKVHSDSAIFNLLFSPCFEIKSLIDHNTCFTKPVILAQLPLLHPFEALNYLPYLPPTPGLTLDKALAIFYSWYKDLGAWPIFVGPEMLEFITPKPLNERQSRKICLEILALCPKLRQLVIDNIYSVDDIQAFLKGSHNIVLDFSLREKSIHKPYGY